MNGDERNFMLAPRVPLSGFDVPVTRSISIEDWLEKTEAPSLPSSPITRKRKRIPSLTPESKLLDPNLQSVEPACQIMPDAFESSQAPPLTPAHTASERYPSTPTKSQTSRSQSQKSRLDPDRIATGLKKHGLLRQDEEARYRYPDFFEEIRDIVNPERASSVKPRSVQRFRVAVAEYEVANEDSFLENVLPRIIKETHDSDQDSNSAHQRRESLHTEKDDLTVAASAGEAQRDHKVQHYFDEGLRMIRNADLRKNTLPNVYLKYVLDPQIAQDLAKEDGMTTPRPDYTYGLRRKIFASTCETPLSYDTEALLEVAPFVHQPFFIIEGKSDRGELAEAENQAIRGGAALVNAGRQLRERIGEKCTLGPDRRTFVFSATISPKVMEVWVHWAEVSEARTVFHMHDIVSKSLADEGALVVLRRALHNILDWGCCGRMPEVLKLYARIDEWEGQRLKQSLASNTAGEGDKASNKRKKRATEGSAGDME